MSSTDHRGRHTSVEQPSTVSTVTTNSERSLPNDNTGDDGTQQPVRRLTAYEKLTEDLNNDPRALKEITLGKRIAFYRIRGELGSGNFSQVKMGIHALTKGKIRSRGKSCVSLPSFHITLGNLRGTCNVCVTSAAYHAQCTVLQES